PYTLFYDGLFRNKKHEKLKMAELGILDGEAGWNISIRSAYATYRKYTLLREAWNNHERK
ncbi:MAG: hypothetical protein EB127_27055, partial [Alphaproteobacteria bacterium]|nr:hypothetical protein [Alphaproteobacteria bacterium]